jgi:hypothetical protein
MPNWISSVERCAGVGFQFPLRTFRGSIRRRARVLSSRRPAATPMPKSAFAAAGSLRHCVPSAYAPIPIVAARSALKGGGVGPMVVPRGTCCP